MSNSSVSIAIFLVACAAPAFAQFNPGQLINLGRQIIQTTPQQQSRPPPPVYHPSPQTAPRSGLSV